MAVKHHDRSFASPWAVMEGSNTPASTKSHSGKPFASLDGKELRYHSRKGDPPGLRFARFQVTAFILSCLSLALFSAGIISSMQSMFAEIILLLWRWCNEVQHGQYGPTDLWHHGSFLAAFFLLIAYKPWRIYSEVAVYMQILHVPLVFWYWGGRGDCISEHPRVRALCVWLFRPSWMACVGFRFSYMAFSVYSAYSRGAFWPVIGLSLLNLIFSSLDVYWTKCFLGRLGYLDNISAVVYMAVGALYAPRCVQFASP